MDTGAFKSTVCIDVLNKIPGVVLSETKVKAKGYGNNEIVLLGETVLMFKYKKRTIHHNFLVVPKGNVSLLGRDLCRKMNIKLEIPGKNINVMQHNIHAKFKDYFSSSFESCVKETVTLPIKQGVTPVFCKARSVPFRYKEKVKEELKRLED